MRKCDCQKAMPMDMDHPFWLSYVPNAWLSIVPRTPQSVQLGAMTWLGDAALDPGEQVPVDDPSRLLLMVEGMTVGFDRQEPLYLPVILRARDMDFCSPKVKNNLNGIPSRGMLNLRHNGGFNALFGDGHVKKMKETTWPMWAADPRRVPDVAFQGCPKSAILPGRSSFSTSCA